MLSLASRELAVCISSLLCARTRETMAAAQAAGRGARIVVFLSSTAEPGLSKEEPRRSP
jgi:hypothetical protein